MENFCQFCRPQSFHPGTWNVVCSLIAPVKLQSCRLIDSMHFLLWYFLSKSCISLLFSFTSAMKCMSYLVMDSMYVWIIQLNSKWSQLWETFLKSTEYTTIPLQIIIIFYSWIFILHILFSSLLRKPKLVNSFKRIVVKKSKVILIIYYHSFKIINLRRNHSFTFHLLKILSSRSIEI